MTDTQAAQLAAIADYVGPNGITGQLNAIKAELDTVKAELDQVKQQTATGSSGGPLTITLTGTARP